jgi:hypothetical protein
MKEKKKLGRPKTKWRTPRTLQIDIELCQAEERGEFPEGLSELVNQLLHKYRQDKAEAYSDIFNPEA